MSLEKTINIIFILTTVLLLLFIPVIGHTITKLLLMGVILLSLIRLDLYKNITTLYIENSNVWVVEILTTAYKTTIVLQYICFFTSFTICMII